MFSSSAIPSTSDEVLFNVKNDVGIITLNRPRVLNSLNYNMVKAIYNKLKEWERICSFVIVQGAGEKAFCAGGDVVAATKDKTAGKAFFRQEYKMNHLIGSYRIPYISIIDGITMGGGVGISIHGPYRLATERTVFAMPETAIGLFPDVGGSHFLPSLEGKLGLFLGLTGMRLQGFDVLYCGIGTHFLYSKDIPKFMDKLINEADPTDLRAFFQKNCLDVSHKLTPSLIMRHMEDITGYFGADTVIDIMKGLYRSGDYWAKDVAEMMKLNSPTSLAITKRQLDLGQYLDLKECLKMEYRLSCAALDKKISPDFYEGITSSNFSLKIS